MPRPALLALAVITACSTPPGLEPMPDRPGMTDPDVPTPSSVARAVPVYGGTMASDRTRVVAADPGADRVSIHTRGSGEVSQVALPPGSEPFRVHIDQNLAFVTLRGTGSIASVDVNRAALVDQAEVCPEPRGVAVSGDSVYVACASREVVELDRRLRVRRSVPVATDLRDIVVEEGVGIWVSRFRSVEVLRLGEDLEILDVMEPRFVSRGGRFVPRVAWRMRAHPVSGVVVLHQMATQRTISLDLPPQTDTGKAPHDSGGRPGGGSPYGAGGDLCSEDGLVSARFSRFSQTSAPRMSGPLEPGMLPVDFDLVLISDVGYRYTLAAGSVGGDFGGTPGWAQINRDPFGSDDCVRPAIVGLNHQNGGFVTSVATMADGYPMAYTRWPSAMYSLEGVLDVPADPAPRGHEASARLFHEDAGAGIACASCHPEGQDDGHTWNFDGLGPRRTQNLAGGVLARSPFHWDGEFDGLDGLMADVFVRRMGGEPPTEGGVVMLGEWLHGIRAVQTTPEHPGLVAEGRELFHSVQVGCAECHFGPQLADHQLHTVHLEPTRTPSLTGVGNRGPWMHTGCATTLQERFTDASCGGGNTHGRTSHLTEGQVEALVAYLESL